MGPETVSYGVPDISCGGCRVAITRAVSRVPGVETVAVDVKAKTVTVSGVPLDEAAILAAIEEAGNEVAA